MRVFIPLVVFACGCASEPRPTAPARPDLPEIHDVGWLTLGRDYQTASSYTGRTVRIRFDRGEYASEGTELRAWAGLRTVPPVLLIRLTAPLPADLAGGPLVLVGRCLGPTRDGTWRSPRADFVVHVTEATATAR